jgi:hypothetical protein
LEILFRTESTHSHLETPSSRVPCPFSDRIINDGRPNKHEDHTWEHASTVDSSTDGQGRCDSNEHALGPSQILKSSQLRTLDIPGRWQKACRELWGFQLMAEQGRFETQSSRGHQCSFLRYARKLKNNPRRTIGKTPPPPTSLITKSGRGRIFVLLTRSKRSYFDSQPYVHRRQCQLWKGHTQHRESSARPELRKS